LDSDRNSNRNINASSDCHCHCYHHSDSYPNAYADPMHGQMCTDTEASPNSATATVTDNAHDPRLRLRW
jgi:hypothetical protein